MKQDTTLNTTMPIKVLTPNELLALDNIAHDDDNPVTCDKDWAGATLKVGKQAIGKTRGKQKAPTKVATTIRLDPAILDYFKSQGKGWQTAMNNALREYIATH